MTAAGRPSVLAVLGSVTPPGRLHRALAEALERAPVEASLLDLAELDLGFVGRAGEERPDRERAIAAVSAADAVVFATPVYRGSMTGALKNLFDALPVASLEGKPVATAAMGASDHHFLGADRHLRDVLAFFGALPTPVSAYLTAADFDRGRPGPRAEAQLDALLAGLASLTLALRGADPLGPRPLAATTTAAAASSRR